MRNNIKRIRLVKKEENTAKKIKLAKKEGETSTQHDLVHMISIYCDDSMYEMLTKPSYMKFAYSTLTVNQNTGSIVPYDTTSKYGLFYCYGTDTMYDNLVKFLDNRGLGIPTPTKSCRFQVYLDCTNFNYALGAVDTFVHLRDKLRQLSSNNDMIQYYDVLNQAYLNDIMSKPSPFKKADIIARATDIACSTDINNCAQNDVNLATAQAKSVLFLHYLEKVLNFNKRGIDNET